MEKIKKCLSVILIVFMLFSIVLPEMTKVKASSSVTLESLQKKYPHGKYWNGGNANSFTSTPCTHHGSCSYSGSCGCNSFKGHAIQCMGFAYQLAYLVYGGDPYVDWTVNRNVSALNTLKAGDVVRYKNNGHSIFVTAVTGNTVTYADCNSDGHCKIRWGQTILKSTLKSTFTYVDSAPYKWEGGGHTHSYVEEYEAAHPHRVYKKCNSCEYYYYTGATKTLSSCSSCKTTKNTLSIKYDANGGVIAGSDVKYVKYMVATSAGVNMRSGAGTGYDTVLTIPTGKTFVVTSTKTANGYTWGQTTYNDITGWCVISEDWTTKSGTQSATKYYLNSSGVVYTSSTGTVKVQEMVDGKTYDSGLYNYTTFGISRTGYTFAGWGTSSSGGTVYSQSESMTAKKLCSSISNGNKTITLYAIWKPNILSVYFNANGASIDSDTYKLSNSLLYYKSDNSRHVQQWTYNNKKTDGLVNASTLGLYKIGYTFAGWGTKASGGTIYSQSDKDLLPLTINSNLKNGNCSTTLYAIWKANEYTIKYDANGGTGAPANQVKTHDKALTLSSVVPIRKGYKFLGWGTSKNSTVIVNYPGGTYGGNQDYTYYAIWKADEYTVKYNANSGIGAPISQTKIYGITLPISTVEPERAGYEFLGWSRNSNSTAPEYLPGDSYTINADTTLYAVWRKITLTSIKVCGPNKVVYYMGESLDTSDLKLRLEYSDGSFNTIDSGYNIEGFESSTEGYKTVTVSYGGKTDKFEVYVIASSVSLSEKSLAMSVGEVETIYATTDPAGGSVKWSVSNNSVITVSNGKITAVGPGTATVKATFYYKGYYSFASCDVSVKAIETLSSISVSNMPTKTVYGIGEKLDTSGLKLQLTWSDGTTKTITSGFTTNGFDSASAGIKRIVVSYGGKSTSYEVEVIQASVSLSKNSITLNVEDTYNLIAKTNLTGGTIKWSVENSSIATVSNGSVTAKNDGITLVKVIFEYKGHYSFATCDVIVKHEHDYKTTTIPATLSSNGSITKKCTICGDVASKSTIYKISSVKLSTTEYTYTGAKKTPTVTVNDSKGKKLVEGKNYKLTYSSSTRKDIGRYSVKVTFMGDYSGSKTLYYTIGPQNPSSVKATLYGYDDVKVSWSKVSGASGYKVYYKKSTTSTWSSKTTTGTSIKLANLADGVKYDIKVVTYKTKSGYKCYNAGKATSTYTLTKVTGIKAAKSGSKVKVSWTNIAGETGYQISKSTKKSGTSIVATYKTTSGPYKTISATKKKTYYYKVRAYKVVDGKKIYGPWSTAVKYIRK